MRPGGWVLLGATGFAMMVGASAWAPLQPELINSGACEIAPCGTLEDPERWRWAWWLWMIGALLAALAAAFVLPPQQPEGRVVLLVVMSAVLLVIPLVVLAGLLSLVASVQGVATAAAGFPLVWVAVLGSRVRARRAS